MTTEEKLKELILNRYHSIRDFTNSIDLPYTTLDSMFRRGIDNSSVANVIKVCKALGISADALADGEIAPIQKQPGTRVNDRIEVKELVEDMKDILNTRGGLTIDGYPMTVNAIDSIIDAMDIGVEMAKRKSEIYNKK
jgi:hypothetical protein